MIKLYGLGFSNNVSKVRYCLNQLGLKYDWVQTNPMQGENRTPEFLNISPTGKIPAIDIDGFKLFESNAICRYLTNIKNSPLYPADLKKRAVIDAWMDYGSIHVGVELSRILFNRVLAPMLGQKTDEGVIAGSQELLDKFFPIIEKQLAANKYLAGEGLTLADINLLSTLDPCELGQISLDKYPAIIKWRNALKAEAFYQACYKDYTQYIQETMTAKAK